MNNTTDLEFELLDKHFDSRMEEAALLDKLNQIKFDIVVLYKSSNGKLEATNLNVLLSYSDARNLLKTILIIKKLVNAKFNFTNLYELKHLPDFFWFRNYKMKTINYLDGFESKIFELPSFIMGPQQFVFSIFPAIDSTQFFEKDTNLIASILTENCKNEEEISVDKISNLLKNR